MLKILYIIDGWNIGGAQEILLTLNKHLDKTAFVTEAAGLHGEGELKSELEKLCSKVDSFGQSKYNLMTIIKNLWRYLKTNTPDVVHLHLEASTVLGTILARLAGTKYVVVSIHSLPNQVSWLVYRMFVWLSVWIDRYIVEDRIAYVELMKLGVDKAKIRHIPIGTDYLNYLKDAVVNGTTIREEFGLSQDSPLILNIARLHPRKGQEFLLKAMKLVLEKVSAARLLLVGWGEEDKRLKLLASKLGVEGHVIFAGKRRDLINFYACANIFVMAAVDEGMGVCIYEAMACGLPVIAFNAGSINEVVIHEETGLLTPVRDYEVLAESIINVLQNEESGQKYGRAGKKRIEKHFQGTAMARKYEQVYLELSNECIRCH